MKLSDIGEFGLIHRIRARFPLHESVILGIGDDAAAIRPSSDSLIIATSDMFLEGIHFDLSFSTHFQIGFKAISVNISDIAAMGGRPTAALISLALPEGLSVQEVDSIFDGIEEAARGYGISIVGGDTCRSNSGLILSIALLGEVEEGCMIRRSGASPGDAVFVTGTLGDSTMGLELLRSRFTVYGSPRPRSAKRGGRFTTLIERHLMPDPRIEEGRLIAKNKWATSMIDISDGLASDLIHICDESGVGTEIYTERIPMSKELREVSAELKRDPLYYALGGGEDYELLFTVPRDRTEEIKEAEFKGRPLATMIGEVVEKDRVLIDEDGRRKPLTPIGYDHFRKREIGS